MQGVFVAIGHDPATKVFRARSTSTRRDTSPPTSTRTNVEGVFVAGDVYDHRYRQAVSAAGLGCMAALDVEKWLESARRSSSPQTDGLAGLVRARFTPGGRL